MAQEKRPVENKTSGNDIGAGPYLAKIINHLDPSFMGSLEVTLLRNQGNQMGEDTQTYVVRCAQPFFGYTAFEFQGQNVSDFNDAQKSYGMWFVPPDPGVTVIVVFIDGDPSQGYWIGCVPARFGNHMVPAIGGTTQAEQTAEAKSKYNTKMPLPVAEANRRSNAEDQQIDVEKIKKAVHPIADRFLEQGLLEDDVRGTTTSTSRREAPSMVFGISTPGPLDKRSGAKKANIGTVKGSTSSPVPVSRLGGTTFVMDDGDERYQRKKPASEGPVEYADVAAGEKGDPTIPYNEYFRVRTRTGHQILMHNSEDLIYIGNAKGTTWIELTANGKVDIYAQDSISIHSENDLNIKAARDINMEAGRNFNIRTETGRFHGDIKTNFELTIGKDSLITTTGNLDINTTGNSKIHSKGTGDLQTDGALKIRTEATLDIKSASSLKASSGSTFDIKSSGVLKVDSGGTLNLKSSGNLNLTSGADTNIKSSSRHIQNASGYFSLPAGGGVSAVSETASAASAAAAAEVAAKIEPLPLHDNPSTKVSKGWKNRYQSDTIQSIMRRIPMHEPWTLHENMAPQFLTPDNTDREA